MLKRIEETIRRWSKIISLIGLIGLLCLSFITVGAVLLRTIFGISILGVYDASELIVAVVVASCLPLASIGRGHVSVRVLGPRLGNRTNHLFSAFSALVSMVFFMVMAWQLWKYVSDITATHETTWIVHIPLFPWWMAGSLLITLCIPLELFCFIRSLAAAVTSELAASPADPL